MYTIKEIAKMIDHSVLHPTYTDNDLKKQCLIANEHIVATVCVKPYHTKKAFQLLSDSEVLVCAVIGFPHGNSTIKIKAEETLQVIKDGAAEVDMVVNAGKVLQGDWEYIEDEIREINSSCINNGAILKVIFETDFITNDKDKIKLCEICSKYKVAFVKTSTGYGFVKDSTGKYGYKGATEYNVKLMRKHCSPEVRIKAAGGIRNLNELLILKEAGADRIGATATSQILEEAKIRYNDN